MRSSQHRHSRVCYHYRHALPTFGETRLGKSPQGVRHLTFYECAEPRVGMARVPFWAGTHANPSQTAAPASPRQRTRDFLYNEARERSEHFFPWFSKEKKASS